MKITKMINGFMPILFAITTMLLPTACYSADTNEVVWTDVNTELNDIDPRLRLGRYIENVSSNYVGEAVIPVVQEYIEPVVTNAIRTATNLSANVFNDWKTNEVYGGYASVSNTAMNAITTNKSGSATIGGDFVVNQKYQTSGGSVSLTSEAGGPLIELERYDGTKWTLGYGWILGSVSDASFNFIEFEPNDQDLVMRRKDVSSSIAYELSSFASTNAVLSNGPYLPLSGDTMRGDIDMGGHHGGPSTEPMDSHFIKFMEFLLGYGEFGSGFGIYKDDGEGLSPAYMFNDDPSYEYENDVMRRKDLEAAIEYAVIFDDKLVPSDGEGTSTIYYSGSGAQSFLSAKFPMWSCNSTPQCAVLRNRGASETYYHYDPTLFQDRLVFWVEGKQSGEFGCFSRSVYFPESGTYSLDIEYASAYQYYPTQISQARFTVIAGNSIEQDVVGINDPSIVQKAHLVFSAIEGNGSITIKGKTGLASPNCNIVIASVKATLVKKIGIEAGEIVAPDNDAIAGQAADAKATFDLVTNEVSSLLTQITPMSYSELKNLRTTGALIPGGQYRITNYVATTTQAHTIATNHVFDIIVIADSTNVLNETARAIRHDGDIYFPASTKFETWELKYCLDNDSSRFEWADTANGRGVIYRMKDEFYNDCPYDFKNILFQRWAITNITSSVLSQDAIASLSESFVFTSNGGKFFAYKDSDITIMDESSLLTILALYVDASNTKFYFTFDSGSTSDNSISGYSNAIYSNRIKEYVTNSRTTLNCIVFLGNYCYSNTFGNDCYYNTFGNYCSSNTFGNYCYYNMFGNYCYSNTFGNSCYSNTFGNYYYFNTFGNDCYYNTFGNDCYYNTFGDGDGVIGNGYQYISFDAGVQGLTLYATNAIAQGANYQYVEVKSGISSVTIVDTNMNQTVHTTYQPQNSITIEVNVTE